MTTLKTWNEEATQQLLGLYNGVEDNERLDEIAKQMGRTVPAVRSKLVSLKVYERSPQRSVGGASSVRKIQLVSQIAQKMGVDGLDSLEKASKTDLETLLQFLSK